MDWSELNVIPHIVQLPGETSCLWRAVLLQHGILVPITLHQWKGILDAAPRATAPTVFVDLSPNEVYQLRHIYGFPQVQMPLLPDEPDLSRTLVDALSSPIPDLLRQSQIAFEIARQAAGAHIIVLLVLDGLAYEDVLDWQYPANWQWTRRPCFVDGITLTTTAMPRVIGLPPLAHRLFQQGYKQHYGFTYWERDSNDLTDTLFAEFSKAQLTKVSEFSQILDRLADSNFSAPTYVQIVRNGLDQFVHSYRERPNVRNFLRELEHAVWDLLDLLATFQCSVRVYVTADHGILWYEKQPVTTISTNSPSARYVTTETHVNDDRFTRICEASEDYTVAVGPYHICRNRRVNEWGFHGGISGRESVIPFLTLDYRPQEHLYA
ncbi:MAG: alkaline phosphatase family protein [Caldilineaceae bacterium]